MPLNFIIIILETIFILQRIYREIIDLKSGIVEKFISEYQNMFQYSDFLDADEIGRAHV